MKQLRLIQKGTLSCCLFTNWVQFKKKKKKEKKKSKVKLMVELLIGLTASLDEYTDSSFCVHKA